MNILKMAALAATLGTGLVAMDHGDEPSVPPAEQQNLLPEFTEAKGEILNAWFLAHVADPFPSDAEKTRLAEETQLSVSQVSSWFINVRSRQSAAHRAEALGNNQHQPAH